MSTPKIKHRIGRCSNMSIRKFKCEPCEKSFA